MIPPWLHYYGADMPKKPPVVETTTTHVAAVAVHAFNRTVQRCAVCGEKLADSWDPDLWVSTGRPSLWGEAELVREDHGFLHTMGLAFQDANPLPRDLCMKLVER